MSYDKKIGLDLRNPEHRDYVRRMGVTPIDNDLDALLPKGHKEPEPKLWLPNPRSHHKIRKLIDGSENGFLIPGQMYQDKKPLVSILADTHVHGFPTALLDQSGYSLRLRFEKDPDTGEVTQLDYNEKSAMAQSAIIGGLADRDEREGEFGIDTSLQDGYDMFVNKYRNLKDPAFCDKISFNDYRCYAGYIAARNEYGFVIKHPKHNVLFVFEGCEDIFDTVMGDMSRETCERICEWEFERRQVIGNLPSFATRSREAFKEFLYSSMIAIRDDIALKVPGALINLKSKAEVAKEHLANHYEHDTIENLRLSGYYNDKYKPVGSSDILTPVQHSLASSKRLEATMTDNDSDIFHRCGQLHRAKDVNNKTAPQPNGLIGLGNSTVEFNNDNRPKIMASVPVASIG